MRRWAIAVLLVTGTLVAGCGNSSDPELPTFEHAVRGDRVDPDSFLRALRASFRSGSTASIGLDIRGGASLKGRGSVRYTANSTELDLRLDDWKVPGSTIDIRTVGGTTYMRVAESRGLWVDLDTAEGGLPGADLADQADPREAIADLRKTISEVRYGGTETLGGTRTRRFQVTTVQKGGGSRSGSSGTPGSAKPAITQYWFDGRDRIVRRQSELHPVGDATFTWTKWGTPVSIERPEPKSVVTLKQLEKLRREQAGHAVR